MFRITQHRRHVTGRRRRRRRSRRKRKTKKIDPIIKQSDLEKNLRNGATDGRSCASEINKNATTSRMSRSEFFSTASANSREASADDRAVPRFRSSSITSSKSSNATPRGDRGLITEKKDFPSTDSTAPASLPLLCVDTKCTCQMKLSCKDKEILDKQILDF